jgi:hypothetical protein
MNVDLNGIDDNLKQIRPSDAEYITHITDDVKSPEGEKPNKFIIKFMVVILIGQLLRVLFV